MDIWTEYYEDSTKYFAFWNTEKNGFNPQISSISIEAEMVFEEDEAGLIKEQASFFSKLLDTINSLWEYKLYIIMYCGISDPISSISRYKKLWKKVEVRSDFSGFVKSKEVEFQVDTGSIFCGLLQFDKDNIEKAVEIVNQFDGISTIIASRVDLMGESEIIRVFNEALLNDFNKNLQPEVYKINYRRLCMELCKDYGIVVRVGNAAEEVSFGVFLEKILYKNVIEKVDFKEFM
ncbi:hypothetical protein HAHI6034_01150 [Hathewaya histolytica]|uniref:Uncharacterized protein n=1 Tax=Hathewaya histolytica TaxID=1498 RepID=A0A4U9QYJ6_HATHI|nr:hypothetical protein [Hathewaya histolytica]VTQ83619.1 Uncharacterised protein [Hathewaya histolytica]